MPAYKKGTPEYEAWIKTPKYAEMRANKSVAHLGKKRGPHSEATKRKIGKANKGKSHQNSPETRAKIAAANTGHGCSEETRVKLRSARKRQPHPFLGKHHSEETKAKLREARKGQTISEETRTKISQTSKGRKMPPESVAKGAAKRRGRLMPDTMREKLRAANIGRRATPEQRAQMSASRKGKPNLRNRGGKRTEVFKIKAAERERTRWANATDEEKKAWRDKISSSDIQQSWIEDYYAQQLDTQGIVYERQKLIGWYKVDFYIESENRIIEVNGCYWHCCERCGFNDHPGKREQDAKRYAYLRRKGYIVEVIWGHDLPRKPHKKAI